MLLLFGQIRPGEIQGGPKICHRGPLLQDTSSSYWKATATNQMLSNDLEASHPSPTATNVFNIQSLHCYAGNSQTIVPRYWRRFSETAVRGRSPRAKVSNIFFNRDVPLIERHVTSQQCSVDWSLHYVFFLLPANQEVQYHRVRDKNA